MNLFHEELKQLMSNQQVVPNMSWGWWVYKITHNFSVTNSHDADIQTMTVFLSYVINKNWTTINAHDKAICYNFVFSQSNRHFNVLRVLFLMWVKIFMHLFLVFMMLNISLLVSSSLALLFPGCSLLLTVTASSPGDWEVNRINKENLPRSKSGPEPACWVPPSSVKT